MKKNIESILNSGRAILLDGAMGTELQNKGMPSGTCPELWCCDNPEILESVHQSYCKAGSAIVYSATFGANRAKLSHYNISDVAGVNRKLVTIAKKAVSESTLVAGDIGPTGCFVEPFGELGFEKAISIFKEQARALYESGVDLFVIETMMDIQEARAALIAVKEVTPLFTAVTMTFEEGGRTLNGNSPESVVVTLQSLGADAGRDAIVQRDQRI